MLLQLTISTRRYLIEIQPRTVKESGRSYAADCRAHRPAGIRAVADRGILHGSA
jgi:hypothetical protein